MDRSCGHRRRPENSSSRTAPLGSACGASGAWSAVTARGRRRSRRRESSAAAAPLHWPWLRPRLRSQAAIHAHAAWSVQCGGPCRYAVGAGPTAHSSCAIVSRGQPRARCAVPSRCECFRRHRRRSGTGGGASPVTTIMGVVISTLVRLTIVGNASPLPAAALPPPPQFPPVIPTHLGHGGGGLRCAGRGTAARASAHGRATERGAL
jgi:hypothetical protein